MNKHNCLDTRCENVIVRAFCGRREVDEEGSRTDEFFDLVPCQECVLETRNILAVVSFLVNIAIVSQTRDVHRDLNMMRTARYQQRVKGSKR